MTSNHHAPIWLGLHTCYNGVNKGKRACEGEQIPKNNVSVRIVVCNSDYMKLESLVIANQNVAGEYVPGLVHTARHTMGVGNARSQ